MSCLNSEKEIGSSYHHISQHHHISNQNSTTLFDEQLHIALVYAINSGGDFVNKKELIAYGTPIVLTKPWGQTGNLILALEHAIHLADTLGSILYADLNWHKFLAHNHLDRSKFIVRDFPTSNSPPNGYSLNGADAYFMVHPKPGFYSRVILHFQLRFNAHMLLQSEPRPLATIHDRDMDGMCLDWIKNPWMCLNYAGKYNEKWKDLCMLNKINVTTFLRESIKPNISPARILLLSDGHRPITSVGPEEELARVLSHEELHYLSSAWLCVLSDIHVGNPASSIDMLISHWRLAYGKSAPYPRECFDYITTAGKNRLT